MDNYKKKENIERIFNQDSRDKKRTGSNVAKRASRRGYCRGGVKFPSDYLSRKEKKLLNGEVKVYSKYDDLNNVPKNITEFIEGKSDEEVKKALERLREVHKPKELAEHFGFTTGTLSYYLYKYGVVERQKKSKSSGVEIYKDLNEVPSWDEIKKMAVEKQFSTCFNAKDQFGVSKLCRYWKKSSSTIHKFFTDLGIYEAQKKGEQPPKIKKAAAKVKVEAAIKEETAIQVEDKIEEKAAVNIEVEAAIKEKEFERLNYELLQANIKIKELENKILLEKQKESLNGLQISFNGVVNKSELENRLLAIAGIAAEGSKYKININLQEISEKIK